MFDDYFELLKEILWVVLFIAIKVIVILLAMLPAALVFCFRDWKFLLLYPVVLLVSPFLLKFSNFVSDLQ